MKEENAYFEQVEDYLENNLSSDDRFSFVEELSKNELLQREVHKHQIAYSIIEMGIEKSLRKKLEELSKKDESQQENRYNSGYILIIIFFVATLVLLAIRYFFT